jgi:hypothetical protein
MWVSSLLGLMVVFYSLRFWFVERPQVTAYEFDWFVGWLGRSEPVWGLGRWMLFVLLLGAVAHYAWHAERLSQALKALSVRRGLLVFAPCLTVYALGWPMVSPDVFFYLGKGWAQTHYGLEVFQRSITDIPGYLDDPMFDNIYPGFKGFVGNYGPAFHAICQALTALAKGNLHLALLYYKLMTLAMLITCCLLLMRFRQRLGLDPWSGVVLTLGSPLILLTFVTCAHNDMFLALAFCGAMEAAYRRWWGVVGTSLALGFSMKYIPLIVVPLFVLYAWKQPGARFRAVLALSGAFVIVSFAMQLIYPGSWQWVFNYAAEESSFTRSSLITWMMPLMTLLEWDGYSQVALGLNIVYMLLYAGLWLRWFFLPSMNWTDLARLCVTAIFLYLMIPAVIVTEWYLLWPWFFLLMLPGRAGMRWVMILSLTFPLMAILTVGPSFVIVLSAQLISYLMLFCASWDWMREMKPWKIIEMGGPLVSPRDQVKG